MRYIKYALIPMGMALTYFSFWLSDDCFVTFRYISNLFAGNGLVYNAGEYVEGFTHPLWLAMLIPFYPDLELASQMLGVLSFGALIYLLTRSGWLAAALVVCNMEMRIWTTGGLETMFFTFLVFFAVWATLEKKNWTGWILLAMVLTRPDGILIAGVVLLFNWKYYKPLLLLIPFLALRYFYYGDLLPNTYYAKSGTDFIQGFYYIWVYLSVYVSTFLFLYGFKYIKRREIALPIAIIFTYLVLFVAQVGGDFMYARFIIPIIPLVYFVIEQSFKELKNITILISILILSFVIETNLRTSLFYDKADQHKPAFELGGVTDESWYWSHDTGQGFNLIDLDRMKGNGVKDLLNGTNYTILLRSQCAFAYYLGVEQTCVMSEGLTDKYIARLPGEGRVGHQKIAPLEYINKRGVNFLFNRQSLGNYYGLELNNPRYAVSLIDKDIKFQIAMEVITIDDKVKRLFK